MPRSVLSAAGYDVRRIVTILAMFVLVLGTFLGIPAAGHAAHAPAHESTQLHNAPLQNVLTAIADSHCQQNAGCHVAVLPSTISLLRASGAEAFWPPVVTMADTGHPNDVFHPPRGA